MANFTGEEIGASGPFVGFYVVPFGIEVFSGGSPSFMVVAYDPLRGDLATSSETTLRVDVSEVSTVLDTDLVTIQINSATIFSSGIFFGEYTGSSIIPQGGGVFRFNLVKATPWAASARVEVRLFLPPETP